VLILAGVGAALLAIAALIGPPSQVDTLTCDVGGPCSAVYARLVVDVVGWIGAWFAVVGVPVAVTRAIRLRRRARPTGG